MNRNPLLYITKKILLFLVSILILSILVFYISRKAPGDPLVSYYGDRTEKMSAAERHNTMERLGLNDPIHIQYIRWIENAAKGNFGISFKYKQNVLEVIEGRITNTLILGGIGFVLTFVFSLLLGILCAWNEDSLLDRIVRQVGTAFSCIPEFWFALVLILVFSVSWGILPSSGAYSTGMENDVLNRIRHLILPMAVVISGHLWYYAYMIRNKLLEEVRADYVLLAKSKGLTKKKIMFRHCLRNIMPTFISIMAISVPHILGGTYVVETVFSYPGIGTLSYESARFHDYNLLMLLCMLTGIVVIFFNILGQAINEQIDPRIKANEAVETSEVLSYD
ncbi:MAG: ABC transporter permease [Ruminococcaceae bacterium]|nr:ABC transporter permease [Oscillospiraceae bacterium]